MKFNILKTEHAIFLVVALVLSAAACTREDIRNNHNRLNTDNATNTPPDRKKDFSQSPDIAAKHGLNEVRQLASAPPSIQSDDDEYARALGFSSAAEAGRAQLGIPLSIYRSSLLQLNQFTQDSDPIKFSAGTNSWIYPLLVDGQVKSSLTVTKSPQTKQWQTTEWGSPALIRLLEKNRRPQSNIVFLISPQNPLGLRFIGEQKEEKLFLAPISDIPKLNLKAGQQMSVREVFIRLAPMANDYRRLRLQDPKRQPQLQLQQENN